MRNAAFSLFWMIGFKERSRVDKPDVSSSFLTKVRLFKPHYPLLPPNNTELLSHTWERHVGGSSCLAVESLQDRQYLSSKNMPHGAGFQTTTVTAVFFLGHMVLHP